MWKHNKDSEPENEIKDPESEGEIKESVPDEKPEALKPENKNKDPRPARQKKPKKKWKRVVFWVLMSILILIVALIVAAGVTLTVMYNRGKISMSNEEIKVTAPEGVEVIDDGAEVHYKGGKYNFNKNIVSILIMGVDKRSMQNQTELGTNGQADAVFLLVADMETGNVDVINVSRDSMVDVSVYSPSGAYVRDGKMQLCMAYSYGDGRESSCQNVIKSLSKLMYGIPINSYFSMDLEAIRVMTNEIGGVSVPEYTEDLTKPTGRNITVSGKQAEIYVRDRNVSQLDSNLTRMDRQKAFISAFASKMVSLTKSDITAPLDLYYSLEDYICTDINADRVTYLAANFLDGVSDMQFHSVKGNVVKGEKYAEFEVDTEALYELILDVFYVKVG